MSQIKIISFEKGLAFEGFLLVRSARQRTSNNGNNYLDMTLGDNSGDINAKVWDPLATPPDSGIVLKVRAAVTEYNGRLQLRVDKFRPAIDSDPYRLSDLVTTADRPPEEMRAYIDSTIDAMENPVLKTLCRALIDNVSKELTYYPAAQSMHHAYRSGLMDHMTSMLRVADGILPCYPFLDKDLVKAGILVHDLSKIGEMIADSMGTVSEYSNEGLLLGHLVVGVAQIREIARQNNIPPDDEYLLLLQHMVISHHGLAEYGSPKPPMFPEAEMLSAIDELDARMNEMKTVIDRTPRGLFSEKIWSLDRRVYHPKYFATEPEKAEQDGDPHRRSDQDIYERLL